MSSTAYQRAVISIHALREEGDRTRKRRSKGQRKFLSTPSARRATTAYQRQESRHTNFYPRPPRGGRPCSPRFAKTG